MDIITKKQETLYDTYQFGNFLYRKKLEKDEPLLHEFLSLVGNNHKLFDIGCGSGFWLNTYLKCGINKDQITVVDLAPSNITNLKKEGFNAILDNVLDLKIKKDVSDFTVCLGVIHHTINPLRAFKELARITKDGGYIYLSVYNKWNPYFYIVHKLTTPFRYFYWNISKIIEPFIYMPFKIFLQLVSKLIFREFVEEKTAKVIFMDQVLTERAHLFTKSTVKSLATKCNCEVINFKHSKYYFMLAAILRVHKNKS